MIVNWVSYILTAAVATAVIWGGSPDGAISREDAELYSADVATVIKKKLRRPKRAQKRRTPPAPRPIPMITPWSTMIAPSWSSMVMPPATPPGGQPISEGDRQTADFKETARQIAVLAGAGRPIGPEHYQKLTDALNAAERYGFPKDEIGRLREMLAPLDPNAIKSTAPPMTAPTESVSTPAATQSSLPASNCVSNPAPVFSADITDLNRIAKITPPGVITREGAIKSHSYLWIADGGAVPIYAPVAAELVAGTYHSEQGVNQYFLVFRVSCEVEFHLHHFLNPIPGIRAAFPHEPKTDTRTGSITPIPFRAGELLGYTSGTSPAHNWDFGVYNNAKPDADADVPGAVEKDKIANCPYDYYLPEKKSRYYNLMSNDFGGGTVSIQYCDR